MSEEIFDQTVYPQAVLGWRAWRLRRGKLVPLHSLVGGVWEGDTLEARCILSHSAPQEKCSCGLYATWESSFETGVAKKVHGLDVVYGLVAARGVTQIQASGFRASEMQLLALYTPEREHREALSARYAAPLVDNLDALRLLAQQMEIGKDEQLVAGLENKSLIRRVRDPFLWLMVIIGLLFNSLAIVIFAFTGVIGFAALLLIFFAVLIIHQGGNIFLMESK